MIASEIIQLNHLRHNIIQRITTVNYELFETDTYVASLDQKYDGLLANVQLCFLHIGLSDVVLTDLDGVTNLVSWPITHIRMYGVNEADQLVIETGW